MPKKKLRESEYVFIIKSTTSINGIFPVQVAIPRGTDIEEAKKLVLSKHPGEIIGQVPIDEMPYYRVLKQAILMDA